MNSAPKELWMYETSSGKSPFTEWIHCLKDKRTISIILVRLDRLRHGNPGQFKALGHGLFELKIDFGAGYRVYFGQSGLRLIIILCGGDKSTQSSDIQKAHDFWSDYRRRYEKIP
jgi:putative addiction module killer protein